MRAIIGAFVIKADLVNHANLRGSHTTAARNSSLLATSFFVIHVRIRICRIVLFLLGNV